MSDFLAFAWGERVSFKSFKYKRNASLHSCKMGIRLFLPVIGRLDCKKLSDRWKKVQQDHNSVCMIEFNLDSFEIIYSSK